jgi:hypothetical protein
LTQSHTATDLRGHGLHGREDIAQLQRMGKLRATVQKDLGTRDDHIGWFSEAEVSAPTLRRAVLLQKGMALELQKSLRLPLRVPSRVMCSCYPGEEALYHTCPMPNLPHPCAANAWWRCDALTAYV